MEPPVEPPPPPVPPKQLPAGIHVLAGVGPTLPYTDLEPLRAIIGSSSVVALGESTHTSHGYYQAKARLIRFMVEEMGFRTLAFETPWLEALPTAAYVASCGGTARGALAGLNGVWRANAVMDLLAWLCEYNRTHPADPVRFYGFDVQEPWMTARAVKSFLQHAAPAEEGRADSLFRCLGASVQGSYTEFYGSPEFQAHVSGNRNEAAHAACLDGIASLEAWFAAEGVALAGATSGIALEEARLALVSQRAMEQQLWVPDPGGYQARDEGMARLALGLRELHAPGSKTIVWAWNWHIARRYEEVRGFNDDPAANVPRQGARAMGSFLHEALGEAYLPIGLVGYRVQQIGTSPPIPTHALSLERRLNEFNEALLLVDLRQPLGDTITVPGRTYQISQEWGDPYRQFSALLFLSFSPAMVYVDPGT